MVILFNFILLIGSNIIFLLPNDYGVALLP